MQNHANHRRSDSSHYPLNINGWVSLASGFLHKPAAHHRSATCPYCPKMFVNPQALGGHLHGHRRERDALRRECALQKGHKQQQQEKSNDHGVRILNLFPSGRCRDDRVETVLRPDLIHLTATGLELRLGRAGEEPSSVLENNKHVQENQKPQEFRFGILQDEGTVGGVDDSNSSEDTVTCSDLKELREILEEETGDGGESMGGGTEADSMEIDLTLALWKPN